MKRIESIWYFLGERAKKKSCICKMSSVKFEKRNQSPNLRMHHVKTRDPVQRRTDQDHPNPPHWICLWNAAYFKKWFFTIWTLSLVEMFCLTLEAHRSPIIIIIIVAGQRIVFNSKLSFLNQLGRKCNPLKLPVLVNRCHFLHIFTFRNLYTLYKSKKCEMTCSYYKIR